MCQPERCVCAPVVFEVVGRVGFCVQYSAVDVEDGAVSFQFQSFANGHQLAVAVGLEACREWRFAADFVDFHHAAGQITVFCGRNSPHHFHALNVVGRNAAHVHAPVRHVAAVFCRAAAGGALYGRQRRVLKVGIRVDGSSVHQKQRAERRNAVIVVRRGIAFGVKRSRFTQSDGVCRIQVWVF